MTDIERLKAAKEMLPSGYVIMPKEPTPKMLKAMTFANTDGSSPMGEARRMRPAYEAAIKAGYV